MIEGGTVRSYVYEASSSKMKITSVNFLRLSLLIPYIFAILLYVLSSRINPTLSPTSDPSGAQLAIGSFTAIVAFMRLVYLLGAIYWLLPYSILVIILWIWSKKKTRTQIYRVLIWTPVLLAILIFAFSIIMSSLNWLPEFYFLEMRTCTFPLSLFFGYVFIGLIAWIYDFLKSRNIIVDEETITPTE